MTNVRPRKKVPTSRRSRNDDVQQRIKQLILQRGLLAGDPMPTEFELMEEMQISRNSVREALKGLQAVGIIDIRHGYGMYVGQMSLNALADELTFHGKLSLHNGHNELTHLVETRELIEVGLVGRTLERRSQDNLDELAEIIDRMDAEAAAGGVSPETDRAFHELLYRPLANPLTDQLLRVFWDVYNDLQHDLPPVTEDPMSVAQRHRDIYLALVAGDRDAASEAVSRHFDGIRDRIAQMRPGAHRDGVPSPTPTTVTGASSRP